MKTKEEELSLSDYINSNGQLTLTDEQLDALIILLGHRCRVKTYATLCRRLTSLSTMSNYGIFDRVMITPRVEYVAGQSYPDEIRTVRELIIKG